MLRQVVIGAAMNALNLLKSERHLKLYVGCSIGIVRQLLMVVVAIVLVTHAKSLMPGQSMLLPVLKPLHFSAGLAEELHLHLLELAHTEDELAGHNLISEGLTYLCYAEWELLPGALLHAQEVYKDALCRLWAQVNGVRTLCCRAHLGREHEVKLAHVGPVLCTADGVDDALILDYLLKLCQVRALHSLGIAFVQGISLLLMLEHTGIGSTELSLIEGIAEALLGLRHLLVNLLVVLCYRSEERRVGKECR